MNNDFDCFDLLITLDFFYIFSFYSFDFYLKIVISIISFSFTLVFYCNSIALHNLIVIDL